MDIISHLREALANLLTAKLRSFLAILGILVGTGSVVALITSSQLATAHALAQFKTLGTNLLAMSIENNDENQKTNQINQLKLDDMPIIQQSTRQLQLSAPYINVFENIYYQGKSVGNQLLGATSNLATIAKMQLAEGRFVSYLDHNSFYAVIGSTLAKKMRGEGVTNPIGQQIQVGNWIFTVIGILKPWQPNLFLYTDINNGAIIPLKTSYLLSSYANINNVLFRLIQKPDLPLAQAAIKAKVQLLLPDKTIRFRNPEQIIGIMSKQQRTFTWLLASIGGISLLVGGIGVMNIMLVSVVERRREIGIRMAIGAKRADIRQMFLIEAIILTVFGGIIGIVVGLSISYVLAYVSGWEFYFYALPPILGFIVSVLVGIISGFYPAFRASRLDPIETLQSE